MAPVLIDNLPDALHRQLKLRARRHQRSLNQALIARIEDALDNQASAPLPAPVKLNKPLRQRMLDQARREGRA
jgi:plasmid stability protein